MVQNPSERYTEDIVNRHISHQKDTQNTSEIDKETTRKILRAHQRENKETREIYRRHKIWFRSHQKDT